MNGKIQIVLIKRNGRDKAIYRFWSDSAGRWTNYWHHMTVKQARAALKSRTTEIVAGQTLTVEEYA